MLLLVCFNVLMLGEVKHCFISFRSVLGATNTYFISAVIFEMFARRHNLIYCTSVLASRFCLHFFMFLWLVSDPEKKITEENLCHRECCLNGTLLRKISVIPASGRTHPPHFRVALQNPSLVIFSSYVKYANGLSRHFIHKCVRVLNEDPTFFYHCL